MRELFIKVCVGGANYRTLYRNWLILIFTPIQYKLIQSSLPLTMRVFRLSIAALASYNSIVVALPAEQQRRHIVPLPDHAAEAGPVLENRAIHPSCVRPPCTAHQRVLTMLNQVSFSR